jgi:hypothetical protein
MKLFCRHEWEEVRGTRRLYNIGTSKEARFKCCECGKEKWFDIFTMKRNTYVFKEYNKGAISDGSHTFDELYHHRMVLFSIICSNYSPLAWKSWKHHDGTMYENYFIVGINTPEGQYSYHYHKDNWDKFNVPYKDFAPEWDGHKPEDIGRLLSLPINLADLMGWLQGEKFLIDEHSSTMTADFEDTHKWELSRNVFINKAMKKVGEMTDAKGRKYNE